MESRKTAGREGEAEREKRGVAAQLGRPHRPWSPALP